MLPHLREEEVELVLGKGAIDLPPPDVLLGARLAHDELVVRRAPGVRGRDGDERPHVGDPPLLPAGRRLDELRRHQVPVHGAGR